MFLFVHSCRNPLAMSLMNVELCAVGWETHSPNMKCGQPATSARHINHATRMRHFTTPSTWVRTGDAGSRNSLPDLWLAGPGRRLLFGWMYRFWYKSRASWLRQPQFYHDGHNVNWSVGIARCRLPKKAADISSNTQRRKSFSNIHLRAPPTSSAWISRGRLSLAEADALQRGTEEE